jgi:hypothetical protein
VAGGGQGSDVEDAQALGALHSAAATGGTDGHR